MQVDFNKWQIAFLEESLKRLEANIFEAPSSFSLDILIRTYDRQSN